MQRFTSKVDAEETEKGLVVDGHEEKFEQDPESRYPLPETDSLWYLSQSKNHRHLLKHPVITSFLWLKWTRIRLVTLRSLFGKTDSRMPKQRKFKQLGKKKI